MSQSKQSFEIVGNRVDPFGQLHLKRNYSTGSPSTYIATLHVDHDGDQVVLQHVTNGKSEAVSGNLKTEARIFIEQTYGNLKKAFAYDTRYISDQVAQSTLNADGHFIFNYVSNKNESVHVWITDGSWNIYPDNQHLMDATFKALGKHFKNDLAKMFQYNQTQLNQAISKGTLSIQGVLTFQYAGEKYYATQAENTVVIRNKDKIKLTHKAFIDAIYNITQSLKSFEFDANDFQYENFLTADEPDNSSRTGFKVHYGDRSYEVRYQARKLIVKRNTNPKFMAAAKSALKNTPLTHPAHKAYLPFLLNACTLQPLNAQGVRTFQYGKTTYHVTYDKGALKITYKNDKQESQNVIATAFNTAVTKWIEREYNNSLEKVFKINPEHLTFDLHSNTPFPSLSGMIYFKYQNQHYQAYLGKSDKFFIETFTPPQDSTPARPGTAHKPTQISSPLFINAAKDALMERGGDKVNIIKSLFQFSIKRTRFTLAHDNTVPFIYHGYRYRAVIADNNTLKVYLRTSSGKNKHKVKLIRFVKNELTKTIMTHYRVKSLQEAFTVFTKNNFDFKNHMPAPDGFIYFGHENVNSALKVLFRAKLVRTKQRHHDLSYEKYDPIKKIYKPLASNTLSLRFTCFIEKSITETIIKDKKPDTIRGWWPTLLIAKNLMEVFNFQQKDFKIEQPELTLGGYLQIMYANQKYLVKLSPNSTDENPLIELYSFQDKLTKWNTSEAFNTAYVNAIKDAFKTASETSLKKASGKQKINSIFYPPRIGALGTLFLSIFLGGTVLGFGFSLIAPALTTTIVTTLLSVVGLHVVLPAAAIVFTFGVLAALASLVPAAIATGIEAIIKAATAKTSPSSGKHVNTSMKCMSEVGASSQENTTHHQSVYTRRQGNNGNGDHAKNDDTILPLLSIISTSF